MFGSKNKNTLEMKEGAAVMLVPLGAPTILYLNEGYYIVCKEGKAHEGLSGSQKIECEADAEIYIRRIAEVRFKEIEYLTKQLNDLAKIKELNYTPNLWEQYENQLRDKDSLRQS